VCHAEQIAAYSVALADRIGSIIDAGEFPVVLGGDCSILLGSALAMHRLGDVVGGRLGLVFVDGHSDFRHPGNASYVGAAAGEDLALVTGRGQADLAGIEGRRPSFRDIDVVVLGIRAQDEYRLDLQAAGIITRPVPALRVEGAARTAQWARDQLSECAGYWVHVDVDVLDPAVMPAVDAPDPGGIAFAELELLLSGLVDTPRCLGVEITVFDPDYDPDGSYAAEIVETVVAGLAPVRMGDPLPARPAQVASAAGSAVGPEGGGGASSSAASLGGRASGGAASASFAGSAVDPEGAGGVPAAAPPFAGRASDSRFAGSGVAGSGPLEDGSSAVTRSGSPGGESSASAAAGLSPRAGGLAPRVGGLSPTAGRSPAAAGPSEPAEGGVSPEAAASSKAAASDAPEAAVSDAPEAAASDDLEAAASDEPAVSAPSDGDSTEPEDAAPPPTIPSKRAPEPVEARPVAPQARKPSIYESDAPTGAAATTPATRLTPGSVVPTTSTSGDRPPFPLLGDRAAAEVLAAAAAAAGIRKPPAARKPLHDEPSKQDERAKGGAAGSEAAGGGSTGGDSTGGGSGGGGSAGAGSAGGASAGERPVDGGKPEKRGSAGAAPGPPGRSLPERDPSGRFKAGSDSGSSRAGGLDPSRRSKGGAEPSPRVQADQGSNPRTQGTAEPGGRVRADQGSSPRVQGTAEPGGGVQADQEPSLRVQGTAEPGGRVQASQEPSPRVQGAAEPSPRERTDPESRPRGRTESDSALRRKAASAWLDVSADLAARSSTERAARRGGVGPLGLPADSGALGPAKLRRGGEAAISWKDDEPEPPANEGGQAEPPARAEETPSQRPGGGGMSVPAFEPFGPPAKAGPGRLRPKNGPHGETA
jgi:arginase